MDAKMFAVVSRFQANTADLALPGRWCYPLLGVTTQSARGRA
jgi:hypothetical protein